MLIWCENYQRLILTNSLLTLQTGTMLPQRSYTVTDQFHRFLLEEFGKHLGLVHPPAGNPGTAIDMSRKIWPTGYILGLRTPFLDPQLL